MFRKAVLCILILSCFSLSSCSGENDEKRDERKEPMEKEKEQALAEAEQKEAVLKEEAKRAEAEGIAVPAGICDRTTQVQKALLAKAEKENCEQMTKQDLQAVVRLYLSKKNITQLKANDFSGLTSLRDLYLSNNQLENLPEGIFSGLTSLQWLSLSKNLLASLPVGIFSGLTSLERLSLDASFQQEEDRIINEVGRDINITFVEGSSDDPL